MPDTANSVDKGHKKNNRKLLSNYDEMSRSILALDWALTALGDISEWPENLFMVVRTILQMPTPILILWGEENIAIYNSSYSKIIGDNHPHLLGKSYFDVCRENKNVIDEIVRNSEDHFSLKKQPFMIFYKDTSFEKWMDLECSLLLDDKGHPSGRLIIHHDVTTHVLEEEAIKKEEEKLRQVIDGTDEGIWNFDLRTRKAEWNKRSYELFGYKVSEVQNPGFDFLKGRLHPEDKHKVQEAFDRTASEGVIYDEEYRVKHRLGHYVYFHAKGKPVYNEQAEIIGIAGTIQDITERRQAEKAIQESEARFRSIFNQSSVGIVQVDLNYNILLINDRCCEIMGWKREELQNANFLTVADPNLLSANKALLDGVISEGPPFKGEKSYTRPDGFITWVEWEISAIKNAEGKVSNLLGVCEDITQRKLAEESLKESEERFRTMAEASGLLIAHTDPSGKVIYFNGKWLNLTGKRMDELIGYGWADLVHEEDRDSFVEEYKNAIDKKEPVTREFRLLSASGEYRWQLAVLSPRFSPNGIFAGYVGSCVDITDRKRTEEALKEKEYRYRTLIEETIVATGLYVGPEFRIKYVNKPMLRNWNKDISVIGKTIREAIPELEEQPFFEILENVYQTGMPYYGKDQKAMVMVDGAMKTYYFNIVVKPLRNQKGEIYGVQDISIDVTDEVLAKTALKESEERFRIMADAAPNMVWSFNIDGSIKYVNKYTLNFLGVSLNDLIEGTWYSFIHPDDVASTQETIIASIGNRTSFIQEMRMRRIDGKYRWLLTQGAPSYYPNGELYGYIGSAIDISDLKEAEAALELKNTQLLRINNDLDNFIYTASHDLKAPISNIEGLINLLNKLLDEAERNKPKEKTLIELIIKSVDRFKNTIRDLTEVAKIQNESEEERSEIAFREILEEVKVNTKGQIDEANAVITADFSQAPTIYFSTKNLRSIMYNLVSNAIKYRSPERPFRIDITTASVDNHYLLMTVKDNGLGIENKDRHKVFSMFKRLHTHIEGSGIGLSIVKKIIDNSGGKLELESEVGKGSVFKIYFKV